MRRAWVALITFITVGFVAGCSDDHSKPLSTIMRHGPTATVMAIGSGITAGDGATDPLRSAWPRLVFNETFSVGSVFVNAASRDATFASALSDQAPLARDVKPDTVLVWLGVTDVHDGATPTSVAQNVRDLVAAVRAGGARRVLVAGLPTITNASPAQATDTAITTAATSAGARVVDIRSVRVRVQSDGDVVGTDAVHRAIANAFEAALRTG